MKKAEDFRKAFGPADAGFRTVMQKTIEGLKAEEEKKKTVWDLRRFRMPALVAALALVVLIGIAAGGGFRGLINRPDEILPGGSLYTAQPIETTLAQGTEQNGTATAAPDENETDHALIQRVVDFAERWNSREERTDEDLDEMLKLCSAEWKEKAGNAREALDEILGDTICAGFGDGNEISGSAGDPVRTLTCENILLAVGNKTYDKFRMEFDLCLGKDGLRYINPESIRRTMPQISTDPQDIINDKLEEKWPGITKELVPVNLSCEKQGVRMELISAVVNRFEVYYVWSLQDLEGDRVNSASSNKISEIYNYETYSAQDTVDLLYEEAEHKYTYGTKRMYDQALPTDDDVFMMGMEDMPVRHRVTADMVPYLKEYGKTEKGIELTSPLDTYCWYGQDVEEDKTWKVLDYTHPLDIALDEDITLTGIGWIGDELHAQIHFTGNRGMISERGYEGIRFETWLGDYGVRTDEEGEYTGYELAMLAWDDTGDGLPDWVEYVMTGTPEDADRTLFEVELETFESFVEDSWIIEVPFGLLRQDAENSGETEYEENGLRYALNADGTATVLPGADNKQMDEIVIPAGVNNSYRVTEIGEGAFEDCTELKSITMPDHLTHIGNRAFRGCTALKSVTMPGSLFSIGESAFEGCTDLTDILFREENDSGFINIGRKAFSGCNSLISVWLPKNITCGEAVFADCENLDSVILPYMATGVTEHMFSGCVNLTSVFLDDGMTYIGKGAFSGCKKLTAMVIPEKMMYIAEEAFKGCENLDSLEIPETTWRIGDRAFEDCTGIMTIIVQTKELEIGEDVWKGCYEQNINVMVDGEWKRLADWYQEAREKTE